MDCRINPGWLESKQLQILCQVTRFQNIATPSRLRPMASSIPKRSDTNDPCSGKIAEFEEFIIKKKRVPAKPETAVLCDAEMLRETYPLTYFLRLRKISRPAPNRANRLVEGSGITENVNVASDDFKPSIAWVPDTRTVMS